MLFSTNLRRLAGFLTVKVKIVARFDSFEQVKEAIQCAFSSSCSPCCTRIVVWHLPTLGVVEEVVAPDAERWNEWKWRTNSNRLTDVLVPFRFLVERCRKKAKERKVAKARRERKGELRLMGSESADRQRNSLGRRMIILQSKWAFVMPNYGKIDWPRWINLD